MGFYVFSSDTKELVAKAVPPSPADPLSRLRGRGGEGGDLCQHRTEMGFHVFGSNSEEVDAESLQRCLAIGVPTVLLRVFVDSAIDFDSQGEGFAVEIDDVCPYGVLAAEPQPAQSPVPKTIPQGRFGSCQPLPEIPGGGHVVHIVAATSFVHEAKR